MEERIVKLIYRRLTLDQQKDERELLLTIERSFGQLKSPDIFFVEDIDRRIKLSIKLLEELIDL